MTVQDIQLRFVDFGCRFDAKVCGISRLPGGEMSDRDRLFANEIAVDVGGCCLQIDGVGSLILDHHFRPSAADVRVPESAAAAVIDRNRVEAIRERLATFSTVWIVTHSTPDFDALCSVYLVYCCLKGEDLTAPWAQQLADYASAVDQCRKRPVPRAQTLHSVLYASLKRKRDMRDLKNVVSFFGEARQRIVENGLNPNFDALFDETGPFTPELRLLRHEEESYQRDMLRARKSIVVLQQAVGFAWYANVCRAPLLGPELNVLPPHDHPGAAASCRLAEGIFLRDPECLLFKEWVRDDLENSGMGKGFTFTAIAYSGGRPGSLTNTTDYFIAIDPERACGAHLYNVWARLQQAEILARQPHGSVAAVGAGDVATAGKPRLGYEGRAGKHAGLFTDPWFDGVNYRCTIVATPNAGTEIRGGVDAGLTDDDVIKTVRAEVEDSVFDGDASVLDFGTVAEGGREGYPPVRSIKVQDAVEEPLGQRCYRFVQVRLSSRVTADGNPRLAEQVGQRVWPFLEAKGVRTVPADFRERHLILMPSAIVVWNRRGIAVAHWGAEAETAGSIVVELRGGLEKTAGIAKLTRALVEELAEDDRPPPDELRSRQELGQEVLRQIVQIKLAAAMPEGLALRRFLEASNFHDVLDSIDALNEKLSDQAQQKRDLDLQLILALGTALGLLFAWNQVEGLGITTLCASWAPWPRFLAGLVVAAAFFVWFWRRCIWGNASRINRQNQLTGDKTRK